MRISPKSQIILGTLLFTIVAILITGFYLSRTLRRDLMARSEEELRRHLHVTKLVIEGAGSGGDPADYDQLADDLAAVGKYRVTIVDRGGRVLGDSSLDGKALQQVDNHAHREEFKHALTGEEFVTIRYSTTVDEEMLYAATAFGKGAGAVRVSKSIPELREATRIIYGALGAAGLLMLGFVVAIMMYLSFYFSKVLSLVMENVSRIADGGRVNLTGRLPIADSLEVGLRRLSDKLTKTVADLAAERDLLGAVLEGMSESVLALDEHRRVTVINSAAMKLFSMTEKPVGNTLLETIRIPDFNLLLDNLVPGGALTSELSIGVDPMRQVLARAVRQPSGSYVLVLLDITEIKRLENLRRDFVSNVSHELRTPVSIIKANAETLEGGAIADSKVAGKFLVAILTNADRLASLISDLLDISQMEEGKFTLNLKPQQTGPAMADVVETFTARAASRDLRISLEDSGSLSALADRGALQQILTNLLDNAVKYATPNTAISVRAKKIGDGIRFEVQDQGPGIDSSHHERLFERFYRVDAGRSREMGGTGLGLAIVKHMVLLMGGKVGVISAPGKGSTFWFELPAA